ncbi:MAG: SH3 domain-containing protein [Chloroflexota bacterium]
MPLVVFDPFTVFHIDLTFGEKSDGMVLGFVTGVAVFVVIAWAIGVMVSATVGTVVVAIVGAMVTGADIGLIATVTVGSGAAVAVAAAGTAVLGGAAGGVGADPQPTTLNSIKILVKSIRMNRSIKPFSTLMLYAATRLILGMAILSALFGQYTAHLINAAPLALPMDNCPPLGNETAQVMIDVDSTLARGAPRWDAPVVTRLIKQQCFYVAGKDSRYGFLLVREGNSKLWVHVQDVRSRGNLDALPIMDDVVTAQTSVVRTPPKGIPNISARARQIYANAASYGRDTSIVAVIGDCNSEPNVYFGRAASGGFSVNTYPGLMGAYQRFSVSFNRGSVATSGSFNAAAAFDPTWADPSKCGGDGPLACELKTSRASILVVSLGTGDQHRWREFEGEYRRILDYTLSQGVLPLLMTKADELEYRQGGAPQDYINNVVRHLGNEYGVPVIDLHAASRDLPNNGLANEIAPQFHLSEEGMDVRMVMTLATLHGVVYGTMPSLTASTPTLMPQAVTTNLPVVSQQPAAAPTATAAANGVFTVNAATINIRNAPSTSGAVIGRANSGKRYAIASRSNGWVYVLLPNSSYGWMFEALGTSSVEQAVSASPAPAAAYSTASQSPSINIRIAAANVRSGAGTANAVVGVAYGGRSYEVIGRNSDSTWLQIRYDGIDEAWIFASLGTFSGDIGGMPVK